MQLIDKINDTEILANRATNDRNGSIIDETYVSNTALSAELKNITDLIPEAATTENQLADKAYVDFNTEQIAAKYLARDAEGNPFLSYAEFTDPDVVFYYAGTSAEPTKNDYVLINGDESIPEEEWISDSPPITRYWYTGTTWSFQYIVNNSPLNATQLAAINSGITKETVEAVEELPLDELLTLPTDVNEYLHDQRCIQLQSGQNIALVILEELSKHTYPYSCKFMAESAGVLQTLEQRPPDDEIFGKVRPVAKSLGGCLINVYCMGGDGQDTPNYKRYAYIELSTQARTADDTGRFKWWCRMAYGGDKHAKPNPASPYLQLHWQKALTNDNYGTATFRQKFDANENIVERVMTDMSTNLKPCHFYYYSENNDITKTLVGLPEPVGIIKDGFQLHVYTSEGDLGLISAPKWKGKYHFELIGHDPYNNPLLYIGYLNWDSTSKPSTWPEITWKAGGGSDDEWVDSDQFIFGFKDQNGELSETTNFAGQKEFYHDVIVDGETTCKGNLIVVGDIISEHLEQTYLPMPEGGMPPADGTYVYKVINGIPTWVKEETTDNG